MSTPAFDPASLFTEALAGAPGRGRTSWYAMDSRKDDVKRFNATLAAFRKAKLEVIGLTEGAVAEYGFSDETDADVSKASAGLNGYIDATDFAGTCYVRTRQGQLQIVSGPRPEIKRPRKPKDENGNIIDDSADDDSSDE